MQPLELLNNHLDSIMIAGKAYPKSRVQQIYSKLKIPRIYTMPNTPEDGIFYEKNRVRSQIDFDGDVNFEAYYPETSHWSIGPPYKQTSPTPVRGLIGLKKEWDELMTLPDGSVRPRGAGLYFNTPISDHRAKSYLQNTNFVPGDGTQQVFDNRRFKNSPAVAELLMRMDAERLSPQTAGVLRQQLLAKHPQLQETVETIHLPAAQAYKEQPFQLPETIDTSDIAQDLEQQIDAIYANLPEDSSTWTAEHSRMLGEAQRLEALASAF